MLITQIPINTSPRSLSKDLYRTLYTFQLLKDRACGFSFGKQGLGFTETPNNLAFKDLYKEIIIRNPKKVGSLESR